jgi:hypothetical protein
MDNVMMIRIVAGIVAVVLLTLIVTRRKRTAAMKRLATKR